MMNGSLHKAVSSGELFGGNRHENHHHHRYHAPTVEVTSSATLPRQGLAPLKLDPDANKSHTFNSYNVRQTKSTGYDDPLYDHRMAGKKSFWIALRDKLNLSRNSTSYNSYNLVNGRGSTEIPSTYTSTVTSKDSGIASELGDSIPSTPVSLVDDKIPGITGIHNLGNTCYMNAVLQCLAHVDIVVEYFALDEYKSGIRQLKKKNKKLESKGEITERLAILMKALWSDGYSKELHQEFKHTVEKYGQQYGGSEQHDAQEFFLWLLDIVHEELSKSQKIGKKKQNAAIKSKKKHISEEELAASTLAAHTQHSQSVIQDLFQAQYRSSLTCPNCGRQSSTFDPFMTISLPIPQQETLPIFATVVFQSRERKPVRFGLKMDVQSHAKDLLQELSQQVQIPMDALLLAKISDDGHQIVFRETDSILQLSEAEQCLYAFEIPDIAYVSSSLRVSQSGSNPTTEFRSIAGRDCNNPNGENGDEKEDKLANTLILIVTNVEIHERRCYRFGFPVMIRVSRELRFRDLQILVRRELPTSIRESINNLARSSRLCFGMRVVEGFLGKDYLSNEVDHPLFLQSVERALTCCEGEKHRYVSVVAEWESGQKWSLAKFGIFQPNEHASVKQLHEEFQQSFEVGLDKCLQLHTKDETLQCDEAWTCPNCKQEQVGTVKTLSLWSLPDVLVFHLKRFQQANQWKGKISTLVNFPLKSLDLSPHLAQRKTGPSPKLLRRASKKHRNKGQLPISKEDSVYDLFAVCDHIGPYMTSGHYTACCKNTADDNWYSFDDAIVKPIAESEVVKKSAYLLFYQRRSVLQRSTSLSSISTASSNHWAQRLSRPTTPQTATRELHI